jgi:hypothetical protein
VGCFPHLNPNPEPSTLNLKRYPLFARTRLLIRVLGRAQVEQDAGEGGDETEDDEVMGVDNPDP